MVGPPQAIGQYKLPKSDETFSCQHDAGVHVSRDHVYGSKSMVPEHRAARNLTCGRHANDLVLAQEIGATGGRLVGGSSKIDKHAQQRHDLKASARTTAKIQIAQDRQRKDAQETMATVAKGCVDGSGSTPGAWGKSPWKRQGKASTTGIHRTGTSGAPWVIDGTRKLWLPACTHMRRLDNVLDIMHNERLGID